MTKPSWSLENAVEIQKEAPYTFYRPSDDVISRLKPGEATVKLIFCFERDEADLPSAERMWVLLEAINDDGIYTGKLDNDPFYIKDLKAGDEVRFGREHIIQYQTLDDELDTADTEPDKLQQYFNRCYVSNQIMQEGYKVGRLYREEPENEKETGWTLLSDHESQEYVDDPDNLQYIAIGKVLNIDDSFIHLLDMPAGSDYARDNITGKFYLLEE